MKTDVLEEVASGVWIRRIPFRFIGLLDIGTKMTVLRVGDDAAADGGGDLVIHSPVPITPEVTLAVDAWPDAKLLAPSALRKKRRDLKIDADLESGAPSEWNGAIDLFPIHGSMLSRPICSRTSCRMSIMD